MVVFTGMLYVIYLKNSRDSATKEGDGIAHS